MGGSNHPPRHEEAVGRRSQIAVASTRYYKATMTPIILKGAGRIGSLRFLLQFVYAAVDGDETVVLDELLVEDGFEAVTVAAIAGGGHSLGDVADAHRPGGLAEGGLDEVGQGPI